MRLKGRKWIYMLIIMGLLVKFLITGVIVILTARRSSTSEKGSGDMSLPPVNNRDHNVSDSGRILYSFGPQVHIRSGKILHSR